MQARGLGSLVAFWERMRNICPKVNLYHGPIYDKDGEQCSTSMDLDETMLATRDFWFQPPEPQDDAWQPILNCYAAGTSWPPICPPGADAEKEELTGFYMWEFWHVYMDLDLQMTGERKV